MAYIMADSGEPDRIRRKTQRIRTRRHLDWVGLAKGQSFVDFGCASGEVVREAAQISETGTVIGVDGDADMLAFAREESERLGLTSIDYRQALIAGSGSTGLDSDCFDHAWTRFFLEYQKDPGAVVREMSRVVRPGGTVNLLDLDGNCIWHYPLPDDLQSGMDEIIRDLATTGFDPVIGPTLKGLAEQNGLTDIREEIEPYHQVIGRPDDHAEDAWRRKVGGIKKNYLERLFPDKSQMADVFDQLLEFILRDDTMTWSLLYLVQGTKPPKR